MSNCSCKGLLKDGNFCECAKMDIPLEPTSLLYRDTERDMKTVKDRCKLIFKEDKKSQWKFSLISAIIFLIISSPLMYNITDGLLGWVSSISIKGCPTIFGLILHTVVFLLISYGIMQLDI
jgi:hypothetical protein